MKKKLLSVVFIALFVSYTAYLKVSNKYTANGYQPIPTVPAAGDGLIQNNINRIFRFDDDDDDATRVISSPPSLLTNKNTAPTPAVPSTPTAPSIPVATTGKFKDGSYTGSVADAYYGWVQVKAVISGGKITDVVFLQYPNDRQTSIEINTQAMPYLKQEAIVAQSANVATVSGASETSKAFRESLGAALALALK